MTPLYQARDGSLRRKVDPNRHRLTKKEKKWLKRHKHELLREWNAKRMRDAIGVLS